MFWSILKICFVSIVHQRRFVLLKNPWKSAFSFSFVKVIEYVLALRTFVLSWTALTHVNRFSLSGIRPFVYHLNPLKMAWSVVKGVFCEHVNESDLLAIIPSSILNAPNLFFRIYTSTSLMDFFIGEWSSGEVDVEISSQHVCWVCEIPGASSGLKLRERITRPLDTLKTIYSSREKKRKNA